MNKEKSSSPPKALKSLEHRELLTQTKSFLDLGRTLIARENLQKLQKEGDLPKHPAPTQDPKK
jgi:hypothetical protein